MTDTTPLPPLMSDEVIKRMSTEVTKSEEEFTGAVAGSIATRNLYEAARTSDRDAIEAAEEWIGAAPHLRDCLSVSSGRWVKDFTKYVNDPCTCGRDAALQTLKDLGITPQIK